MTTSQALTITTVAMFTLLALAWQILSAWAGEQHDTDTDPEQGADA